MRAAAAKEGAEECTCEPMMQRIVDQRVTAIIASF
jgi:hypothetical protein